MHTHIHAYVHRFTYIHVHPSIRTPAGQVRMENFERLKNKDFGKDVIAKLTLIEHFLKYGGEDDDNGNTRSGR